MKAKVNNETIIEFNPNTKNPLIGEGFKLEKLSNSSNEIKVSLNGTKYKARLLQLDSLKKEVTLKVNGNRFVVTITDEYDELLQSMGMGAGVVQKVNELKAPMPGVVFNINVKVGDEIKKDDSLLVLEAMKMENNLKSPVDAVIKAIKVAKGDVVEKNKVLIEFE